MRAVDGVSFVVQPNEYVALTGPSGCGKSTLMHLMAGLDRPTSGQIFVGDLALHTADENALTSYRRRRLGIVFQFFNLLPAMTALENVMFPLLLQGKPEAETEKRAREILGLVDLSDRADRFSDQLSGGEQQRVAIARAIVHRPQVLLADEPTGNLDSAATQSVMTALQSIAEQKLATLIVVTHSVEIAGAAARQLVMRDGKITGETFT